MENSLSCGSAAFDIEELEKYYALARQARYEGDCVNAQKYYGLAASLNPDDWEAVFYCAYYHEKWCGWSNICDASGHLEKAAQTAFCLIKQNIFAENRDQIIIEIADKIRKIGLMFFNVAAHDFNSMSKKRKKRHKEGFSNEYLATARLLFKAGDLADELCGSEKVRQKCLLLWSDGTEKLEKMRRNIDKKSAQRLIKEYSAKIKKYKNATKNRGKFVIFLRKSK